MTKGPTLLTRMREEMLVRRYSPRTVESYVAWVRRFLRYHGMQHPRDLGAEAVSEFLTYLASEQGVAASTQNQALAAVLILYDGVLGQRLEQYAQFTRAKRPERLPLVLSAEEVARVLDELEGTARLMAELLDGSGLDVRALRSSFGRNDDDLHARAQSWGSGGEEPAGRDPVKRLQRGGDGGCRGAGEGGRGVGAAARGAGGVRVSADG